VSKYKLTKEEIESLKVIKLNQDKSEQLKQDMEILSKSWEEKNQLHEKFLEEIESQLGILCSDQTIGEKEFKRESEPEEDLGWDELVTEANHKYSENISFEDLLTQEEFNEVYKHLDEIDVEFEKRTNLQQKDIVLLTIAIGLQCVRQYVIDPWIKGKREKSKPNDEKGKKQNSVPGWYYVPTENILINRVPFDAQNYNITNNSTINGFLKGAKDHRYVTLGHDPILGWIFGTANILTSTITRYDMKSAHVKNDPITKKNYIHSRADNEKIVQAVIDRWNSGFKDGKVAIALAVAREAKHLYSDVKTKDSLPIPGVMAFSPEMAEALADYGIDMASVSTEVTIASLINWLIAVIHKLSFDATTDEEQFFEVRTRKIILYSNLIASTSNVIACYITENYKVLDVGGLLVTITRLISDVGFICKVKDEFIESKLDEHFEGIRGEVESLYDFRFSK